MNKHVKKYSAALLVFLLAAVTLASAVPAKAASYKYVQTSYKKESWQTVDNSYAGDLRWVVLEESKTTYDSKGREKSFYSRESNYRKAAGKRVWEMKSAYTNLYLSDGRLKQHRTYSDIKFKKLTGKSVYTYEGKGKNRVLTKITTYDKSGRVTEIASYKRNSKGQVTSVEVQDLTANAEVKDLCTYKYDGKGRVKSEVNTEYINGSPTSSTTKTYKSGLLVKDEYGDTYRYNGKKQLVEKTTAFTDGVGEYKSNTVTTYSGYDKYGNYTKRKETRKSRHYSTTTTTITYYKHEYKYDKHGNILQELVTKSEDEDGDWYENEFRYTYTYKKVRTN